MIVLLSAAIYFNIFMVDLFIRHAPGTFNQYP